MVWFITGLFVFFGVHVFSAVRSREPGKDIRVKLGYQQFMGLYSLVSIIGFVLLAYGFSATRGMGVLYSPPTWMRHINSPVMLVALVLLVASQLPTGRIAKTTKHPMLLAVKLWAAGHLLANGELNSVILFGAFIAYAIFDRIMVKRRGDLGPGPDTVISPIADIAAIIVGAALWAALAFWLHPVFFGVDAIPAR